MKIKLSRKFLIIGGLSATVLVGVVASAIPTLAASIKTTPVTLENASCANLTTATGSLTSTDSTITVTTSATLPAVTKAETVTVLYNSSTGTIQVLMNTAAHPTITPKNPPNQSFATATGSLTSTASKITVTTTAILPVVSTPETVIILYNNSSETIQAVNVKRNGQYTSPPKNPSSQSFAMATGSLTSNGTTIAVTSNSALPVVSTPETVTIVYNSTSGTIQSLMINRSGQATSLPKNWSNQNFTSATGSLTSTATNITITSSTALPAVSTAETVNILYNSGSGTIQVVMTKWSGPFTSTPKNMPFQNGKNWNRQGLSGRFGF